jgi:hypothetical protein
VELEYPEREYPERKPTKPAVRKRDLTPEREQEQEQERDYPERKQELELEVMDAPKVKRPRPDRAYRQKLKKQEQIRLNHRANRARQITERDKQIFRLIGQGQVASFDLLWWRFWRDTATGEIAKKATSRYRLEQLVTSGYLEATYSNARRAKELIYCLTRSGARLLTPLEQSRLVLGFPGRSEMRQQLDAQDARYQLEGELVARGERLLDWKGERELRSQARREQMRQEAESGSNRSIEELPGLPDLPDARILIEGSAAESYTRYSLDIEIDGEYYGQMLKSKVAALYQGSQQSGREVVWVTATSGRAARLNQEIARAGAIGHLRVMLLQAASSY